MNEGTRGLRLAALLAAVAAAASCKSRSVAPAAPDAEAVVGSAVPSGHEGDPIVDLLHNVEATVAVSSRVDNPHDHPEHILDGKAETAWNSKTGDLAGWIAFRVPPMARVVRVEITAGFDKTGPTGDLFTMNHRIKRVRLSREGTTLAEATLDVGKRTLQGIDVDAPGGDFKLEVLETEPGTQKSWRELTVSELRVWGRAGGAPLNPTHLPKMAVGSLDGAPAPKTFPTAALPRGPFASVADLCAANDKIVVPILQAAHGEDAFPERVRCKKDDQKGLLPTSFQGGPFESGVLVHIDDFEQDHTTLLLKTSKGWFRSDVRAGSHHHMDPGCMHAVRHRFEDVQLVKTSTGQSVAVIRIVQRETEWAQLDPIKNASTSTEWTYACRVDAAEGVTCEGPKRLATAFERLPPGFDADEERFFAIVLEKIPWVGRKKPVLGPAGDLRVE